MKLFKKHNPHLVKNLPNDFKHLVEEFKKINDELRAKRIASEEWHKVNSPKYGEGFKFEKFCIIGINKIHFSFEYLLMHIETLERNSISEKELDNILK